jgi:hypothetical protein
MQKNNKSYPFYVWSGLLTPEHQGRIGPAIWLYLLFINMITKEEGSNGYVLNGKAINYDYVYQKLGVKRDSYFRWLKTLKDNGYIETKQTKYGNRITVLKSKRRKNHTPKESKGMENPTPRVGKTRHLESEKPDLSIYKDDKPVDKPVIQSNNIEFENWFFLYDYNKSKREVKALWDLLSESDKTLITAYTPLYVKATNKNGIFPSRLLPRNFIERRAWLDELPEQTKNVWDQ